MPPHPPHPPDSKGGILWMWLSLKPAVLVPFSLLVIGFRIVTRQGGLWGVWFPLTYEGIALLLEVVIRAHDTWSCCSHLGLKSLSWEWPLPQNCLKLNSQSPVLPPPHFPPPSFQLLRPQVLVLSLTLPFHIPHFIYWKILPAPPWNYIYSFTAFSCSPHCHPGLCHYCFLPGFLQQSSAYPGNFIRVQPDLWPMAIHIWHHMHLGYRRGGAGRTAYQQRRTMFFWGCPWSSAERE